MMCCSENRGKNFWIKRAIFIPIAIVAGVFIFGNAVMFLWNSLLPTILGVGVITFWQALGILVLSKILFGGFHGGRGHHHSGHHIKNKWMHLNPEEREKMREEWNTCCGSKSKTE
jgi:protein-S-isoprenylcysteine O-methyltransferase Ste14